MNIFPINLLVLLVAVIIVIAASCDPWRMGGRGVQIKVGFIARRSDRGSKSRGNHFLPSLNDSRNFRPRRKAGGEGKTKEDVEIAEIGFMFQNLRQKMVAAH